MAEKFLLANIFDKLETAETVMRRYEMKHNLSTIENGVAEWRALHKTLFSLAEDADLEASKLEERLLAETERLMIAEQERKKLKRNLEVNGDNIDDEDEMDGNRKKVCFGLAGEVKPDVKKPQHLFGKTGDIMERFFGPLVKEGENKGHRQCLCCGEFKKCVGTRGESTNTNACRHIEVHLRKVRSENKVKSDGTQVSEVRKFTPLETLQWTMWIVESERPFIITEDERLVNFMVDNCRLRPPCASTIANKVKELGNIYCLCSCKLCNYVHLY